MTKSFGNIIKFILFLGVGIFLVWLITHKLTPTQWHRISQAFREANYWLLIPIFVLGFFSFFFRALRWRLLIRPLGYETGIFTIFSATMIGYMANLAIPRMGEVTRCGLVARYERIPVDKVIGTMLVERVIDVVCLAAVMALTVLGQLDIVGDFFYRNILVKLRPASVEAGWPLYLTILGILVVTVLVVWIFSRVFRHSGWFRKLRKLARGVKTGFLSIGKLRQKKQFLLHTVLIWLCYFLMVYVGFQCFSETSGLSVGAGLSVLSFGSIGMILTQGGIGAYQLIVEKTLELYGIMEAYGFAFGWLSWIAQTLLILVLGFSCILGTTFLKRKKTSAKLPCSEATVDPMESDR